MPERLFRLRVLSPLGTAFDGDVRHVTLPTVDGEITILAHHMPLVATLVDGEMLVDTGQRQISIAIAGGFVETGTPPASPATTDWQVTVLSDFAAESDSIEVARAEAAKARAEQLLAERRERADLLMVERDMQRAILQLKVAERVRTRRRRS